MSAYYNEIKPEAAHMLRQLIKDGLIADGEVDERSITEVTADDVKGFTQCHFFAGIGGWSVALRQAGWPDSRPVWTGSCPCQPFSTAGKQKGNADERHLWPVWARLIAECQPPIIFGEQVASAVSHGWLDGVYADMEAQDYACGSAVLPACSVDAPHKRDRLWFVGVTNGARLLEGNRPTASTRQGDTINSTSRGNRGSISHTESQQDRGVRQPNTQPNTQPNVGAGGTMADSNSQGLQGQRGLIGQHDTQGWQEPPGHDTATGFWDDHEWLLCGDGKIRRIPSAESGICIVAHGLQHRAPLLHAFGNAIVSEVAARFIQACM